MNDDGTCVEQSPYPEWVDESPNPEYERHLYDNDTI